MEKKCLGCGAALQCTNENQIGYTVSLDKDYCQRCFRMIHYDAHKDNDFMADNDEVLKQLEQLKGNYVWIIDAFDFDTSLASPLANFYRQHECHVILNKCDLFPETVNYEKLARYFMRKLRNGQICFKSVITRGVNKDFIESFDKYVLNQQPIIMTGLANVGKSTIINQLLKKNVVTTNPYPATTININEIKSDKYHIFDTVGLIAEHSICRYLSVKDLKKVLPSKSVKPVIFQLTQDQSFAIGGLVRMDVSAVKRANVVFYCSNSLDIHRSKITSADSLWENHYNELLKPVVDGCDGLKNMKHISFTNSSWNEYFIEGLGFIDVSCYKGKVDFYLDPRLKVTSREKLL